MKELDVKYYPGKDYRELFDIMVDSHKCEDTCIGIANDGTLLYVKTSLLIIVVHIGWIVKFSVLIRLNFVVI